MSNEYTELEYYLMHEGDTLRANLKAATDALDGARAVIQCLLAPQIYPKAFTQGDLMIYRINSVFRGIAARKGWLTRRYPRHGY